MLLLSDYDNTFCYTEKALSGSGEAPWQGFIGGISFSANNSQPAQAEVGGQDRASSVL